MLDLSGNLSPWNLVLHDQYIDLGVKFGRRLGFPPPISTDGIKGPFYEQVNFVNGRNIDVGSLGEFFLVTFQLRVLQFSHQ